MFSPLIVFKSLAPIMGKTQVNSDFLLLIPHHYPSITLMELFKKKRHYKSMPSLRPKKKKKSKAIYFFKAVYYICDKIRAKANEEEGRDEARSMVSTLTCALRSSRIS